MVGKEEPWKPKWCQQELKEIRDKKQNETKNSKIRVIWG